MMMSFLQLNSQRSHCPVALGTTGLVTTHRAPGSVRPMVKGTTERYPSAKSRLRQLCWHCSDTLLLDTNRVAPGTVNCGAFASVRPLRSRDASEGGDQFASPIFESLPASAG
jgi:hypothetical protein